MFIFEKRTTITADENNPRKNVLTAEGFTAFDAAGRGVANILFDEKLGVKIHFTSYRFTPEALETFLQECKAALAAK